MDARAVRLPACCPVRRLLAGAARHYAQRVDAGTVINLGVFFLTAISTAVAVVQAGLASTSKREVVAARQQATEAAARATAGQQYKFLVR